MKKPIIILIALTLIVGVVYLSDLVFGQVVRPSGKFYFWQLWDTPNVYTGHAGKGVRVDSGAEPNSLEFFTLSLDDFDNQTAWRTFYSNTDGDVTELAFGTIGKVLTSQGATSAPTWSAMDVSSGDSFTFTDQDASPDAAGELQYDNTVTGLLDGALTWYDDDAVRYLVDLATLPVDDDYVVAYDAENDLFYMKADAGSGAAGTVTTVEDGDAQVGGADIVTLDFEGTVFAITEDPDTEINIDIADDGIDSQHYIAASIDAEHLAADVIDETKIADNGIDSEHYNDGSIDAAHLAADVIDETKIADDGIDSEHYNADSLDNEHINWLDIDNLDNEGTIIVADTADATSFVALWESATGSLAAKSDAGITYNAVTGTLSSTVITEGGIAVHNNDQMDDSSELRAIVNDETGTGVLVFGTSPTFIGSITITGADASPDAAGEIQYDSIVAGMSGGALRWYDDNSVRLIVDLETDASDDDYVVAYDSTADGFYMKEDADTGGATPYDTIGDPTGAGSISFDDTETATYSTAQNTAGSFMTINNTVADVTNNVYLLDLDYSVDDNQANADYLKCQDAGGVVFTIQQNGDTASTGTIDGGTLTEGGQTVWNATETDILDSGHYIADSIDNEHINWADIDNLGDEGAVTLAGLATTLTITDNESTAENNPIVFVADAAQAGGNLGLESDGTLYYTPSTGTVTTTEFVGGGAGVTSVDAITGDSATAFFDAGTIEHEYGGLEVDISGYTGLVAITGGSTAEVDAKSELEGHIADVADFAEADGDTWTGTHDLSGATVTMPKRTKNDDKFYTFNAWNPNALYDTDTQICFEPNLPANITITEVTVTLDADPTTELDWNLKWADAFIGLGNAALIVAIDTTSGTTDVDSGFTDADVAATKCLYIEFDADPDSNIKQAIVKIRYDFD